MPKPTQVPTWATDATFSDPGETWDGASNKTPPGAGKRANGWVPTETPGPEQFNFDQNLHGEWVGWLDELFASNGDHTFPTPPTRIMLIPLSAGFDINPLGILGWKGFLTDPGSLRAYADTAPILFSLNRIIPDGAEITAIRALVDPGAARAGANRMELRVVERLHNWGLPGISSVNVLGTALDDASAAAQVLEVTGLSSSIDNSFIVPLGSGATEIYAMVTAGNDAGTNSDVLVGMQVTYTDPGYRNF